jgi:hypothetical protein
VISPDYATSSFVKKGGYVGITLEAIDRDDTRSIRSIPRELAYAGIRAISATVAALFTDDSSVGPHLADTGNLFNNTAVTTKGGHANLLTTALGTDYTAWEAAASAMYNQPMLIANETGYYGTGNKMAVDPKYLLVPRALRGTANNLFLPARSPQNKSACKALLWSCNYLDSLHELPTPIDELERVASLHSCIAQCDRLRDRTAAV